MSTRTTIGLLVGMLLVASAAAAENVEVTPFVGFQLGGWSTDWWDWDGHDADVEESFTYGLLVDFAITPHAQIELLYSRQDTELESYRHRGRDIDVEYFQIGFLWQFRPREEIRPFVVGSLGVASFDPEGGGGETGFATSVGGGVKMFFSEHLGVRLEGRVYSALYDEDELFDDRHGHHHYYWDSSSFVQLDFNAGLIFRF